MMFFFINPRNSTGGWNNIQGLTMKDNGNVGIGTTSPTNPLHVNGRIRCSSMSINGYMDSSENGYLPWHNDGIHNWRFGWHSGTYTQVEFRNLSGYNNCGIRAASYQDISDDRLKINEKLIDNATDTLMKLRPQTYDQFLNMDCSGETNPECGLIAQEVHYQAPELRKYVVSYPHDINMNNIQEIDVSNNIKNDPDCEALGWGKNEVALKYNGFIPYLIRSNQEQQEEINALKTQLADVLTRLSTLENH